MLNCEQATKLLSESLDRPLTVRERMGVNMHLMMCRGCRNCGQHMQDLRHIAREYARRAEDAGRGTIE
ncbi:MAG: zf-HC2 domain-containing protein [Gammaproteobacteria bacterium]